MHKILFRIGLMTATALAAACGTTRTFVDYSRGSLYATETVGNVPYVEVGPVTASQRGFFWNNCWELAEQAVTKLRAEARQRGANNVSSVRWLNHADGSYTETPICTTGWGWFAAAIFPGFGPWVKVTEVQGRLVHAEESELARLRKEVTKLSSAWQQREQAILAEMQATKGDRGTAERTLAEREAAQKAAAESAAAEKLAANKAAAERAAAQRAAAEQSAADKAAADKAVARKAWLKKEAARKGAAPTLAGREQAPAAQ